MNSRSLFSGTKPASVEFPKLLARISLISLPVPGGIFLPSNLVGLKGFSLSSPIGSGNRIRIERVADSLKVTHTGTLQSAESAAGPYSDVVGVSSPAIISFTGSARFYRARQ